MHDETHTVAIAQEKETPPVCNLEDLSMDLKLMLNSSLLTDINLLVGSDVVRAHKLILSARSPVFAKMIKSGMLEQQKSVIHIADFDMPFLKELDQFLCIQEYLIKISTMMCSLYYAAHKYQVSSLEKTCRQHLLSNMEISNACELLMLADRHSDQDFKSSVIDFIKFHFDKFKISVVQEDLEKITIPYHNT
ncbi:TD and POZ domain-containing protein 1 [Trichonephila clavipes]|nr:TD and POZ domain-containing protein 1 [Trichonephila clavipes]